MAAEPTRHRRAHEPVRVADFLAEHRDTILDDWERGARTMSAARGLSRVQLLDHMSVVLAEIGANAQKLLEGEALAGSLESARRHAIDRLDIGFDMVAVVGEISLLRECIFLVWEQERGHPSARVHRALDAAIDHAIGASVARYHHVLHHERERAIGKLESLLYASPIGIAFLDPDLRYIRINDALAELNGRPVAEHIGKTVREVLPEAAPVLEPMLRRVLDSGKPILNWEVQAPLPSSPGERRTFLLNYFPVRTSAGKVTGVGGIVLEVTARKRVEEALAFSQARLQGIIDHAPAAVYIKDSDGRFELANRYLAEAYGTPVSELIGKTPYDLQPEPFATTAADHDRAVIERGEVVEAEEPLMMRGQKRTFFSIKFPMPSPDGRRVVCGISSDITERKQIEQELRRAVTIRDEVLAIVSHDLRNPLGTIQLGAEMLAGSELDARARKQIEMIQRAATRMEHLIEDLLDTAAIQAGRLTVQLEAEDAQSLVAEAVRLQEPLAADKGVELRVTVSVPGVKLRADRHRMLQLFGNLVGNAIKFCRPGDRVTIAGTRRDADVLFSIEDTGPGIEPNLLSTLFEPYEAAPQGRRTSGLGLYIAKGIVDAHGGRIWAESDLGRGARFHFTIPVAAADAGAR